MDSETGELAFLPLGGTGEIGMNFSKLDGSAHVNEVDHAASLRQFRELFGTYRRDIHGSASDHTE